VLVFLLDSTMPCAGSSLTFDVLQQMDLLSSVKFCPSGQLTMPGSSMPAYYLILGGGSLTIVTSLVTAFGGALNSYYSRFFPFFGYVSQLEVFVLTLLPGLAVLYLGQRFLKKPEKQLQTCLAVVALSVISLFVIVGSAASLYLGVFFSGPPISFTGGIIGAFLNRAGDPATTQPNPPA
jgi:hypothetical protein